MSLCLLCSDRMSDRYYMAICLPILMSVCPSSDSMSNCYYMANCLSDVCLSVCPSNDICLTVTTWSTVCLSSHLSVDHTTVCPDIYSSSDSMFNCYFITIFPPVRMSVCLSVMRQYLLMSECQVTVCVTVTTW